MLLMMMLIMLANIIFIVFQLLFMSILSLAFNKSNSMAGAIQVDGKSEGRA